MNYPQIPQALGTVAGPVISRRAGGTVYKGRGLKNHTTVNGVVAIANAGVAIVGVATYDAISGEDVGVMSEGQIDYAEAGEAVASVHTNLAVDSVGRFVAATTNDVIVGRNETVSAALGDPFVVTLYSIAQSVSA